MLSQPITEFIVFPSVTFNNDVSLESNEIVNRCCFVLNEKLGSYSLWQHRPGHDSLSKLKHVDCTPKTCSQTQDCLVCPMEKFTKLPYQNPRSVSFHMFDLVYLDI